MSINDQKTVSAIIINLPSKSLEEKTTLLTKVFNEKQKYTLLTAALTFKSPYVSTLLEEIKSLPNAQNKLKALGLHPDTQQHSIMTYILFRKRRVDLIPQLLDIMLTIENASLREDALKRIMYLYYSQDRVPNVVSDVFSVASDIVLGQRDEHYEHLQLNKTREDFLSYVQDQGVLNQLLILAIESPNAKDHVPYILQKIKHINAIITAILSLENIAYKNNLLVEYDILSRAAQYCPNKVIDILNAIDSNVEMRTQFIDSLQQIRPELLPEVLHTMQKFNKETKKNILANIKYSNAFVNRLVEQNELLTLLQMMVTLDINKLQNLKEIICSEQNKKFVIATLLKSNDAELRPSILSIMGLEKCNVLVLMVRYLETFDPNLLTIEMFLNSYQDKLDILEQAIHYNPQIVPSMLAAIEQIPERNDGLSKDMLKKTLLCQTVKNQTILQRVLASQKVNSDVLIALLESIMTLEQPMKQTLLSNLTHIEIQKILAVKLPENISSQMSAYVKRQAKQANTRINPTFSWLKHKSPIQKSPEQKSSEQEIEMQEIGSTPK